VPGVTAALQSALRCGGCGWQPDDPLALPPVCAHRGDSGDHVLLRELSGGPSRGLGGDALALNPFVRWRKRMHAWHLARRLGWRDSQFVALVEGLDQAVQAVDDGRGFHVTPLNHSHALAEGLGMAAAVWVKDETGQVGGSHKARHLFGILLGLEVLRAHRPTGRPAALAIASCGNAAVAAAVLAAAAKRRLLVFLPPDAHPRVVARLRELDAKVHTCRRASGATGDPTVLRFRQAVADGAVPFACQGTENGHAIEGGETLAWELATAVTRRRQGALDRVFVQVGGGALCSALVRGLDQAVRAGILPRMPRIHPVQTRACYPLARAYQTLAQHMDNAQGAAASVPTETELSATAIAHREARAHRLADAWASPVGQAAFHQALRQRSGAMVPWPAPGHSIAHGILDDETYDWAQCLRGVFGSGGYPVVVSEAHLAQGNWLAASATGIAADATGSAGLAGLLALRLGGADAAVGPDEGVAVLLTGCRR